VAQVPEFLAHMPAALRHVLESGVATGGICALVLNWFLPDTAVDPLLHTLPENE
jgi:xanthine permease XanP